ncbi:beta-lactamase [Mycena capillaripes]|nr:beta-lactamase [Mycena capillaripes]
MASPSLSAVQMEGLDRILSDAVASQTTGALFFSVTTADGPIYTRTLGTKLVDDLASGDIDEDTVFWLCSQTKLITTIAALQLIEQGKIALDTPVETILPELANPVVVKSLDEAGLPATTAPAQGKITFGQLLNHTSGLDYSLNKMTPLFTMSMAYSHSYKNEDVSVFFKILKGSLPAVPLKFEPGQTVSTIHIIMANYDATSDIYGYSTDCAGFVVERLSGKSLEQYFQDHIFSPLGITSASFYLTPPLKDRLLPLASRNKSGLVERRSGLPVFDQNPAHVRVHLGGVGLYSSQKDYLTVLRHLLQIKAGRATNPILSRASVDSMFSPTLPPAGVATLNDSVSPHIGLPAGAGQFGRGLMVTTADVPGKRRSGAGGWGGWASTSFFVDPTTGVAAVFGMQVVRSVHDTHKRLFSVLEREVYKAFDSEAK